MTLIDRQMDHVDLYFYINVPQKSSLLACHQFMPLLALPQLQRLVIEVENVVKVADMVKNVSMPSFPFPMVEGPDGDRPYKHETVVNQLYFNNAGW